MMLKQILSQQSKIKKRPIDKIENEISHLKSKIQKIEDGYADGQITAEVMNNSTGRCRAKTRRFTKCFLFMIFNFDLF